MKLHILVDSREKIPWVFPSDKTSESVLKTGDYSVWGYKTLMAIEHKMWDEYIAKIALPSARAKFVRDQLKPLSKLERSVVIVEGCVGDVIRYSRLTTPRVVITTAQLVARYGVPILFFRSRELAMTGARMWLIEAKKFFDGR